MAGGLADDSLGDHHEDLLEAERLFGERLDRDPGLDQPTEETGHVVVASLELGTHRVVISFHQADRGIVAQESASSERMWLEIRIVFPILRNSPSSAFISRRARGSRPEAGSSRISTGGSWTSVLARQSRCFIPLERPLT